MGPSIANKSYCAAHAARCSKLGQDMTDAGERHGGASIPKNKPPRRMSALLSRGDGENAMMRMIAGAVAVLLWASAASAGCLAVYKTEGDVAYFKNECDTKVDFLFRTERGRCASNERMEYPCGRDVPAGWEVFFGIRVSEAGRFWWHECIYPMGVVEVRRGHVICADGRKGNLLQYPYTLDEAVDPWDHPDLAPYRPEGR